MILPEFRDRGSRRRCPAVPAVFWSECSQLTLVKKIGIEMGLGLDDPRLGDRRIVTGHADFAAVGDRSLDDFLEGQTDRRLIAQRPHDDRSVVGGAVGLVSAFSCCVVG